MRNELCKKGAVSLAANPVVALKNLFLRVWDGLREMDGKKKTIDGTGMKMERNKDRTGERETETETDRQKGTERDRDIDRE